MEPSLIDDGEFWLPPEFLTDEDFLMEKENNLFKSIDNGDGFGFGFGEDGGSKFLFPNESRPGLGSIGLNSGLGSPVESLIGSTETESDEENYMAGLTHQMAHSTLEDDFSGGFGSRTNFPADNLTKGWSQSGSPQSTLCAAATSCGCLQRSAQNSRSRVPSPSVWDLYCAAAGEMARMKTNDDPYGFNHGGRGLLGAPRKPFSVSATAKSHNVGSDYYNYPSLPYQKLQAIQFQQLKQQQMMKHRQEVQNRARINGSNNGRSVGISPSAWPNLQHAQQPREGSGMRAVFLGNPTVKRGSTGTGVFLPRRVSPASSATNETRKKQTVSSVLVPARVAHALNLNLNPDDPAAQPTLQPRFDSHAGLNDALSRYRSNNVGFTAHNRGGGMRAEQPVTSNELRLPSDWSY